MRSWSWADSAGSSAHVGGFTHIELAREARRSSSWPTWSAVPHTAKVRAASSGTRSTHWSRGSERRASMIVSATAPNPWASKYER